MSGGLKNCGKSSIMRTVSYNDWVGDRFMVKEEELSSRKYRNALGYHEVIEKGYGFEKMGTAIE